MLFTYKDQIQSLRDFLENKVGGNSESRRIKGAILDALRDLPQRRRWSYYRAFNLVALKAAYTTGTIAYTHTGGAYERVVTLTGGIFPTWAGLGWLVISRVIYKVEAYKSATQITLTVHSNPGANVAALTAYKLIQDSYVLPSDFLSVESVVDLSSGEPLSQLDPRSFSMRERLFVTPSRSAYYTIAGDPNYQGRTCLRVGGPPNIADTLEVFYNRRPRQPVLEEYSTGTVATTASSATVTGTGTTWDSSLHAGSVLRISTDGTNLPTGIDGSNPAYVERIVTSVESATSLTVDTAMTLTLTGKKYLLSDVLDIDEAIVGTAFQRMCEAALATRLNMPAKQKIEEVADMALLKALEADSRVNDPSTAGSVSGPRFRYPAPYETSP